jgi:hypothetical protein
LGTSQTQRAAAFSYVTTSLHDDPDRRHLGFGAEHAHEKGFDMLVNYHGKPDGFRYDRGWLYDHEVLCDRIRRVAALEDAR